MLRVIRHRLLLSIPLILVVTFLSFFLEALTPGSEAETILGTSATPEQVHALSLRLGLDHPFYVQYWDWLTAVLHGDLGRSVVTGVPVGSTLNNNLPVTLFEIGGAVVIALVVGVALGVAGAVATGWSAKLFDTLAMAGLAIPPFWLGFLLVLLFSDKLGLLPAVGYVAPGTSLTDWLRSLLLPVATLSVAGVALIAKQTRDGMRDVLNRPFVDALRARGLSRRSIIFRHALRTALPNVVTLAGLFVISLLLGTAVVESVFALPGLGNEVVQATTQHDLTVVDGVALYFTLIVVVVFTIVDVANAWLSPRQRTATKVG
jgi:peptide/nickel transport system permease protein